VEVLICRHQRFSWFLVGFGKKKSVLVDFDLAQTAQNVEIHADLYVSSHSVAQKTNSRFSRLPILDRNF